MAEKKTYQEAGLKRMSVDNLRTLASEKFGLDVDPNEEKDIVVDEILRLQADRQKAAAQESNEIEPVPAPEPEGDTGDDDPGEEEDADDDEDDPVKVKAAKAKKAKALRKLTKSKIAAGNEERVVTFHETRDDPNDEIHLSLNGNLCVVKKGVEVRIKQKYLNVANAAVITEFYDGPNGEKKERNVHRFPYSVVR